MGWENLSPSFLAQYTQHKRQVVIFPHTSYWDFFLFLVYAVSHWEDYTTTYIVAKPQLFTSCWGKILTKLHFIPASRLEDRGGGFIGRTVTRFQQEESFSLLISPEGMLKAGEWRTGFLILAQQLKCDITVMGLDYAKHKVIISKPRNTPCRLNIIPELKGLMREIIPLYPRHSILHWGNEKSALLNRWRIIQGGSVIAIASMVAASYLA